MNINKYVEVLMEHYSIIDNNLESIKDIKDEMKQEGIENINKICTLAKLKAQNKITDKKDDATVTLELIEELGLDEE